MTLNKNYKHMKSKILLVALLFFVQYSFSQTIQARKVIPVVSSDKYMEFAPTISADGRTLIFESDQNAKKGWELMESVLDSAGNWSTPAPIKSINEKCAFLAGPSISYDGNTLYYTAFIEGVSQSEDIYYSKRINDKQWGEPIRLEGPINTDEEYEGFPSIAADGNTLYFIRLNNDNPYDKKSKENCFTIYASTKNIDDTWGEPQALPASINKGCERDPRIMADNRTLIFSSVRPDGKGKYDLFQSRKQNDGSWSEAVPLDFINSADNDQSPCIAASGDVMYFYSQKDIYSIGIPIEFRQSINVTVHGVIKDASTAQPLVAEVIVKNKNTGEQFSSMSNAQNGAYNIVLNGGQVYTVEFYNENYMVKLIDFDLTKQEKFATFKRNIDLQNTYQLNLSVYDSDLKVGVDAFVSVVSTKGETLYSDTLRKTQANLSLTLKAPFEYVITAAGKKYPEPSKVTWKFNARTTQSVMEQVMNLSYEKVKMTTDVSSVTTKQKVKKTIYYNNANVDEVIIAEAGETVLLRKGDRYQVVTSSDKGYFFSSVSIVAGEGESDGMGGYRLAMQVIPVEVGAQLTLKNITFASNSTELDNSSYVELDRVVDFLKINPNISVEIAAHTDDVGADEYNLRLSERRAYNVLRYLSSKGANVTSLKPVGLGESAPKVANTSEENRLENRRVELKILKIS
ncbi:MAG: OmpA family protein [Cytophagia bacterium]|nr:OmpA family protein [Cytophagia bacterium]